MTKDNLNMFTQLELEVEEQITHVLHTFQNMTEQQLLHVPKKGSWSISQCFQHLNSYGDHYLPLLQNEIKNRKRTIASVDCKSSRLGNYFVSIMDPKQSSKKFKNIKKHIPIDTIPPHQIISTHTNQQESLLVYIREFQSHHPTNKRTIPTSLTSLIKLNVIDTLRFLIIHNSRHIIQASNILDFMK